MTDWITVSVGPIRLYSGPGNPWRPRRSARVWRQYLNRLDDPAPLAVDGHAYRARTRRRTR